MPKFRPPQGVILGSRAKRGPSLVSPFVPLGEGTPLSLSPKRLRPVPFPLQNQSPLRRGNLTSPSHSFWRFRPGCSRFFHQWTQEGLIVPASYELRGQSLDICCHQFVDLLGIFTPCGTLGSSSDCDWRSFGFPKPLASS